MFLVLEGPAIEPVVKTIPGIIQEPCDLHGCLNKECILWERE